MAQIAVPLIGSAISAMGSAAGGKKGSSGPSYAYPPDVKRQRDMLAGLNENYLAGNTQGVFGVRNPLTESAWGTLREMLNPDYWKDVAISPEAYYSKMAAGTLPEWETDVGRMMDTEKAKLGGQYGVRFSPQVADVLARAGNEALDRRNATLAGNWNNFVGQSQTGFGMMYSGLENAIAYEKAAREDAMRAIMGYSATSPATSFMQPQSSPWANLAIAAGNMMQQYPMYKYMASEPYSTYTPPNKYPY